MLERFAFYWKTPIIESGSGQEERVRAILEESLEELDAEDRLLIESKYLEEISVKELSHGAGVSEKALESRLLRLRRQLRERILKKLEIS